MSDLVRVAPPHLRLVWGGDLGGTGTEIWACSLKLVAMQTSGGNIQATQTTDSSGNLLADCLNIATSQNAAIVDLGGSGGPNLADALNDKFLPAIKTFHQGVGRNDATLTWAKLNAFGPDDKQQNGNTVEAQFNAVAGSTGTSLPLATAAVAEFRNANRTRGRASHGRFSYPAAMSIGTAGQLAFIGAPPGDMTTAELLIAFIGSLLLQGTGTTNGIQFVPTIVYTQLPEHTYKKPAVRSATFNPITHCFWSSIPGEVRRRQSALKQQNARKVVVFGNA